MPAVVFVTAHDQFAVKAFEAHALDYLVKPLNVARFDAALQRVREQLRLREAAERAARLSALLAERDQRSADRLVVPTPSGELVLPSAEIDWVSADDYYACVHAGSRQYLLRESLSSLEERLDGRRFIRVHRSAIVRIDCIRELRSNELILTNGTPVPVSRRRRAALERLLRGAD